MASSLPLLESPPVTSRPVRDVQFQMFGARDDFQVRRGVIQGVLVHVVNVLGRLKFPAKHPLHDKTVLGFVMPVAYANVLVSVFDVLAREYALSFRRSVAFVERVMVRAKALCKRRVFAAFDGAFIPKPENLLHHSRVAVAIPAVVVGAAHPLPDAGLAAVINRAKCFRFRHAESIREGMYGVN